MGIEGAQLVDERIDPRVFFFRIGDTSINSRSLSPEKYNKTFVLAALCRVSTVRVTIPSWVTWVKPSHRRSSWSLNIAEFAFIWAAQSAFRIFWSLAPVSSGHRELYFSFSEKKDYSCAARSYFFQSDAVRLGRFVPTFA
jgi:hypothetical protein